MFDFTFANSHERLSDVHHHGPWASTAVAAHGSPTSSHESMFAAFADRTNTSVASSWPQAEHCTKKRPMTLDGDCASAQPFSPTSTTTLQHACASPYGGPNINGGGSSGDMMLVKGDFLCASKLLQLASSNLDQTFTRSTTTTTMDLADSPSRCSTPVSVANAVLFGTDDSPLERQPPPKRGGSVHTREYSGFCVSAGGGSSSRDTTPISPTMGIGNAFTTKLFPPTQPCGKTMGPSQQQQQHPHRDAVMSSPQPQAIIDPCARRAVRSHHVPTVVPMQKPMVVELTAPQTCVLILEFKMGRKLRCRCALQEVASSPTFVGQYFIASVDSTGLEDAGCCTSVVPLTDRHTLNRTFGHSDQATILRMANGNDCDQINDHLPAMEEAALVCCHELIHFLHLPFICVDAEYSFDEKGCKIFYALAPQQCTSIVPNVSRLQRELSFKLKCRIVLEQVRQPPVA